MVAHLDLDAFFASIEIRDHPQLKGKPVVVGFVTPQGQYCNRGVVSAASYEVRKSGVHSGMSLWEAKQLCPELIIISGNFGKYEKASFQVYQIISDYSPDIEPLSLDEAFISFYDCEKLYSGDFAKVCKEIKEKIKTEIGITGSIGLASNKVVAKVASDFEKPDGLTVVPKGEEGKFLAPLPVEKLYGAGPRICAKLTQLGIKTIGQLANKDCNFLVYLFGKYGETLWYFANGVSDTKITPSEAAKSIGRSSTFPVNSINLSYLHQNLTYLSEKVAAAMREENVVGKCISLTLRDWDFRTWSHQKVLKSAVSDPCEIRNLAKQLLAEAWDGITSLRLLGISVSHLAPIPQQLRLWQNFGQRRALEVAVDEIREKFGFWSIRPASILNLKSFNQELA